MDIAHSVSLITGASRGLGRALAEQLAKRGSRVVLVARDAAMLDAAVRELMAEGHTAFAIAADVADPNAAIGIAGQAAALTNASVDILIHNASSLGPTPLSLLVDQRHEDVRRVFDVNVLGPFALTKALIGPMLLKERGLVVSISSDAAVEAYPRWGAYGASKAALDHLSRMLGAELDGTGVSVFAVDPGEMNTRMHAEAMPDADPTTLAEPAYVASRIVQMIETGVRQGDRVVVPRQARAA